MCWIYYIYFGLFCGVQVYCTIPWFKHERFCFDKYVNEEPADHEARLHCDESEAFRIKLVNLSYWRPNTKGDNACTIDKDKEHKKCCHNWLNHTIKCVVPVKNTTNSGMDTAIRTQCDGQSECTPSLKAVQLGHVCKEQCNDSSKRAGDWCWSRIMAVDYICSEEQIPENTVPLKDFIILICVLVPLCILLGVAIMMAIIWLKKKGCCGCLNKEISQSASYHVHPQSTTLPRLPSQPNAYFVEAAAQASISRHQSSRRTAGRDSFSIEPTYCDTEEMINLRESLGSKQTQPEEPRTSMNEQHLPGAMCAAANCTRNSAFGRYNQVNNNENQKRLSSESGIQFDASPTSSPRKVSIVKEMVDNPFYKSHDELSSLPENTDSMSSTSLNFLPTLNTDSEFEGNLKDVNHYEKAQTIDCVPGVSEGNYVIPKSVCNRYPGNYTSVTVSNYDCDNENILPESKTNPELSSTHLQTGFVGGDKRSISPGCYVHISNRENPDSDDNDHIKNNIATVDQVVLPVRKRLPVETNDLITPHYASVSSHHSSSSESENDDEEYRKPHQNDAENGDHKKQRVHPRNGSDGNISEQGNISGQGEQPSMQTPVVDIKLPISSEQMVSSNRSSSISSENCSSFCSSDTESDNYTQAINNRIPVAENSPCETREQNNIKLSSVTDDNHMSRDNYEIPNYNKGHTVLSASNVNQCKNSDSHKDCDMHASVKDTTIEGSCTINRFIDGSISSGQQSDCEEQSSDQKVDTLNLSNKTSASPGFGVYLSSGQKLENGDDTENPIPAVDQVVLPIRKRHSVKPITKQVSDCTAHQISSVLSSKSCNSESENDDDKDRKPHKNAAENGDHQEQRNFQRNESEVNISEQWKISDHGQEPSMQTPVVNDIDRIKLSIPSEQMVSSNRSSSIASENCNSLCSSDAESDNYTQAIKKNSPTFNEHILDGWGQVTKKKSLEEDVNVLKLPNKRAPSVSSSSSGSNCDEEEPCVVEDDYITYSGVHV